MDVVYEQTPLGNDRMLAVIGGRGELRYLFYPNKSFPQNIHSSLPGIYVNRYFHWLTDWSVSQRFAAPGILETRFSRGSDFIVAYDYVLPSLDVLVRRFEFYVTSGFTFIYYTAPQLWETHTADAAYYDHDYGAVVTYKRGISMVVSADKVPQQWQIGQMGLDSDAFSDVYDGKLMGNDLSLYEGVRGVNFALGWSMRSVDTLTLYVIMAPDEESALNTLVKLRDSDEGSLRRSAEDYWARWLRGINVGDELAKWSLWTIKILQDLGGAIIAAPTLWPDYRYCWPRDAAYSAIALDLAGLHDDALKFIRWGIRVQSSKGSFSQRYYADGYKAPSWSMQLDETAIMVLLTYVHYMATGDSGFLKEAWPMVKSALTYIEDNVDEDGLVAPTVGPWEEHLGSHTYTNASAYAALSAGSVLAEVIGAKDEVERWRGLAKAIRGALIENAWNGRFFRKIVKPRVEVADSNTLALVFPFNVIDPEDNMAESNVKYLESSFKYSVGGIGRNVEDRYFGGNPWVITTLWLAIYYKLRGDLNKANQYIDWARKHATGTFMLPEQVDKNSGRPISAIPLAWSHAMYVIASLIDRDLFRRIAPPRV